MSERLRSVGLDVGTTSTQMILSELTVENRASNFAVPEMAITEKRILYRSPVHFTPLLDESHVDGQALRALVEKEYAAAGIRRESVDTGAVIVTGETSRKENAGTVLTALSDLAGEFVVATAGPDLESVLAAKGAGAVALSAETGKTVLHMDIGGGTSNLAWIENGIITETGCLNVGGRLIKFDENGIVHYASPVLAGITDVKVGERITEKSLAAVAEILTQALEMAACLREKTALLDKLTTAETRALPLKNKPAQILSFSGGVADCIDTAHDWKKFGDMGPTLGQMIRGSRLCRGGYALGKETIRATVIGAGCHSTQLSGSTVFYQNLTLPMKNLPVVRLTEQEQYLPEMELAALIRQRLKRYEEQAVLAMPGFSSPSYGEISRLAQAVSDGMEEPLLVAVEQDMAKALGQALALRRKPGAACLCIDRVALEDGSFLDVGSPVGPALPVVVKTLILNR